MVKSKKAALPVFLPSPNSASVNLTQNNRLRARLSDELYAWFNREALLAHSDTLARRKKYLLHVIGHRLLPGVEGSRAVIPRSELMAILHMHRDCLRAPSHEAKRKWVQRAIGHLEALPCTTAMGSLLILDDFNKDHGTDEAIDAHHAQMVKQNRRNKAAWQAKERTRLSGMSAADALKPPAAARKTIVESELYFPLPSKVPDLYNASQPPLGASPKHQTKRFAPAGPKPAAAVSANRAAKRRTSSASNIPGFGAPLISLRPQSGKPIATQPFRADWSNPSFDPRTNCKAAIIYGQIPATADDVQVLARQDPTLRHLRLERLKPGATVETLFAAHHLYTNRDTDVIKHPAAWVAWAEHALRMGRLRYAGNV